MIIEEQLVIAHERSCSSNFGKDAQVTLDRLPAMRAPEYNLSRCIDLE